MTDDLLKKKAAEKEAIENCDKDPIHTPGSIQPHGCLIAVSLETELILAYSENIQEYLEIENKEIFGSELSILFSENEISDIKTALKQDSSNRQREYACIVKGRAGNLQVSVHQTQKNFILELVYVAAQFSGVAQGVDKIQRLIGKQFEYKSIEDLLKVAVEQLREISGFDVVMAYKFRVDYSGEVVAESKKDGIKSYLGLRFPAFDIPPQARELFLKLPIRVIQNVNKKDVKLLSKNNEPIDMTLAVLRGTHPAHIQYLQNMTVKSSMTLPIIIRGKLWGLFATHHYQEIDHRPEVIATYELASKVLGLVISNTYEILKEKENRKLNSLIKEIALDKNERFNPGRFWELVVNKFSTLLNIDGIAYREDKKFKFHGGCPDLKTCHEILKHFKEDLEINPIISSENLKDEIPNLELESSAGCLILNLLNGVNQVDLIFFRNQISQTISWAGSPEKDLHSDEQGLRLLPRASFKEYKDTVQNQCEAWSTKDIEIAQSLQTKLSGLWQLHRLKELVQSNEDLEKYALIASHDLRSPLRAINYLSSVVLEDEVNNLSKESKEALNILISRVNRLDNLLNSLLLYSRVGRSEEVVKECDTKELLESVFESLPNPKKVKLSFDEMPIIQTKVGLLTSIFQNLIENAIKYNNRDPRNGLIKVSTLDKKDFILFKFQDNGPGLEEKYFDVVFDLFRTLHSRDEIETSGIGLTSVKKIVTSYGGTVWLSLPSNGQNGLIVNFTWPKEIDPILKS